MFVVRLAAALVRFLGLIDLFVAVNARREVPHQRGVQCDVVAATSGGKLRCFQE